MLHVRNTLLPTWSHLLKAQLLPSISASFSTHVQSQEAGFNTTEHNELRRTVRKIVEKDINPYVDEWEKEKKFPIHQVMKIFGNAGLLGLTKPTEYGGMGLDYTYSVVLAEELGNINCGGVPMGIGVQTDCATPALARFGSDALKRQFLVPAIAGDVVACIGVSEPGGGSDVAALKTTAVKSGDDYIINGSKMWITNGIYGDWIALLCNTGEGAAHKNKSLICVPLDSPGVTRAKNIEKIGNHCSDTALLFFEDVRVPQSYRIGEEGMGFTYQMLQFQEERLAIIALTVNPLEKIINETIEYTRQRKAFGASLLSNQSIHYRLAELQTEVEALRSMLYRAANQYANGEDVTRLASMGKLKAGRLAREVTDSCLQYWGGMGYTDEVLVSRFWRDFRLLSIGGGADEVMLGIICKYMGTLPGQNK